VEIQRRFITGLLGANMKRWTLFMVCSGFGVLLFAQTPDARIREMSGTVELKLPGQTDWIPAKPGDRIEGAAIVSTGFKSRAVLLIGNSILTVRPLTRLSLEELLERDGNEQVRLMLRTGRIRAEVRPPVEGGIEFKVRSPVITASVRGTVFDLDPVNLRVSEGTVRYEPAAELAGNRPVLVGAGQRGWVDGDTGRTLNPLIAAEIDRALPAMAGGETVKALSGAGGDTRPENPQGSLAVDVTLESQ
jgi:hypothetical protein